ncbi:antirestriction protein [Paraburkholderia sp. RL18-103-BIB-C]|uniref:antirestriction protein n=1 Tax=Paraburkholderia sp. RL18-103-BIB-C TaxID=3031637 RepID=UPI0038BC3618
MSKTITAKAVPTVERLRFLPEFFTPRLMIQAEGMLYNQAGQLCADYKGGYWNFYRLSNGGFYVAPETDRRFNVSVQGNDYEGEVGADAFGVIVTLFLLGALVWIDNADLREKFSDHYYQLRDFAKDHAEAGAIFRAID